MAGLREKNKEERRARIRRATRDVLLEKGFHKATVGEIAERAGVGKGTVFLYAKDKVDLCLMCINDDVDALTDEAFSSISPDLPLIEQVLEFFRARYAFWGQHPELSRAATREMSTAYTPGDRSREYDRGFLRRSHTKERLSEILRRCCANCDAPHPVDFDRLAQVLLDIYLTELRLWLSFDKPDVTTGLNTLRNLMELVINAVCSTSLR